MDKNIGKKLDGRYEITELIGEGGMADVYRGVDIVDKKDIAIKILKEEFAESEEFLRRFFLVHSIRPAGRKVLHIKLTRIEKELNIDRRRLSAVLRQWERANLVIWTRGCIFIPALEKIINR